jgi:hypothetical protein
MRTVAAFRSLRSRRRRYGTPPWAITTVVQQLHYASRLSKVAAGNDGHITTAENKETPKTDRTVGRWIPVASPSIGVGLTQTLKGAEAPAWASETRIPGWYHYVDKTPWLWMIMLAQDDNI